jgi:hypothetical protein
LDLKIRPKNFEQSIPNTIDRPPIAIPATIALFLFGRILLHLFLAKSNGAKFRVAGRAKTPRYGVGHFH